MNSSFPVCINYLNNIGALYITVKLPKDLQQNKEKLKSISFKHKCEDGLIDIQMKDYFHFSFCLNKDVSIINMKDSLPKIIDNNSILQIKYQVRKNAISNEEIYNRLGSSGIRDVIIKEDNKSEYLLNNILCRKCKSLLFSFGDDEKAKIVYDINLKRLDDNINEMFICFEEMSMVKEKYDNIQLNLKNKVNIDTRYIWINFDLYNKHFTSNLKNNQTEKIAACASCNENVMIYDNETLNKVKYAKFDLTKINFSYIETKSQNEKQIENIINECYLNILLQKAIVENKSSVSFIHQNRLVIFNITMNILISMKTGYKTVNETSKNYYCLTQVSFINNNITHNINIDDEFNLEIEGGDILALLNIIEENNKIYLDEINNYSKIINEKNNSFTKYYILKL